MFLCRYKQIHSVGLLDTDWNFVGWAWSTRPCAQDVSTADMRQAHTGPGNSNSLMWLVGPADDCRFWISFWSARWQAKVDEILYCKQRKTRANSSTTEVTNRLFERLSLALIVKCNEFCRSSWVVQENSITSCKLKLSFIFLCKVFTLWLFEIYLQTE